MEKERVHTLDVLKGLCVLMVIFTHYPWTDVQRLEYLFPFCVDMAIPMCMLISGYLYTKSYQRRSVDCSDSMFLIGGVLRESFGTQFRL